MKIHPSTQTSPTSENTIKPISGFEEKPVRQKQIEKSHFHI